MINLVYQKPLGSNVPFTRAGTGRHTHLLGEAQSLFTDDPGTGRRVRQFVDLGSSWRRPLHPAPHWFIHRPWGWQGEHLVHLVRRRRAGEIRVQASQGQGTGLVCRGLSEDLEAVGWSQALPPVEQTLPPALAFWHILLHDGQDIPSGERELIGAIWMVVVKCPGQ